MNQKPKTIILKNLSQILTMESANGDNADNLHVIENGAIVIKGRKIHRVGKESEIVRKLLSENQTDKTEIDCGGGVATPGFIESHTHILYGGSREKEFEMRMEGKSYLEILETGGGILSTVKMTRSASIDELVEYAKVRLDSLMSFGVTTCEIKSGYGLNTKDELKILKAIKKLNEIHPTKIIATFLGAHAIPPEFKSSRQKYIEMILKEMIPEVSKNKLARFCDVYIEKGAYTTAEAERILTSAAEAGLGIKLHAGQFNDLGGAALGVRLGATSIDHLDEASDVDLEQMAEKSIPAVILPGASFFLRQKIADAKRMRRTGVCVAVSTDSNPGSSPTENLPLMMTMAVVNGGLTINDAMKSVTTFAAKALGLPPSYGTISPGGCADIVVHNCSDYRHLLYHYGMNHIKIVIIDGEITIKNI